MKKESQKIIEKAKKDLMLGEMRTLAEYVDTLEIKH